MKKKNDSRRGRALRNLAALACVMLAMHALNLYNFTPGAALRDRERELGIGKTEEIARAEYTDALDAVLSGWEDCLLVTKQRWDPFVGWTVDNSSLYRRDSDQSTQMEAKTAVQVEANASGNEKATYLWLCGWVADPNVKQLNLRIHCRQWYGVDGDYKDVYLTVSEFVPWQGERVFLLTSRAIPATYTVREIWWENEQGEEVLLWSE